MKIVFACALIVCSCVCLAFAEKAIDEKSVLQTEQEICQAYLKGDADVIARYVMEDYALTNSTGKISKRDEDLDAAKQKDPKYEVFENRDMQVRIHGPTAVVTGRTHVKGTFSGNAFDWEFQFTDTLIKDSGRWRLLAGHVSKVK